MRDKKIFLIEVQHVRRGQSSKSAIPFDPTDWEAKENYNSALVIQVCLDGSKIQKFLDRGSVVNLLISMVFKKMGNSITDLKPTIIPLVGLKGK
ncbi:conserved hypothetical protein [Ricinus communis]|uniref:Uncharacterized protein n=1 Tax=Ricinus communis TaxID=3988 RepID=B9SNK3_RICCO|nr:conserved hypothetical protein [Ricinus communis]